MLLMKNATDRISFEIWNRMDSLTTLCPVPFGYAQLEATKVDKFVTSLCLLSQIHYFKYDLSNLY